MDFVNFDAPKVMNAIDGIISDLAAKNDKPQGYPFSKIIVYSMDDYIPFFMPQYEHRKAKDLPTMVKLDFKKAGKVFGEKVKEMQQNLSNVPPEFLTVAERFPQTDEITRKTTGCRKYLVEVETEDMSDLWQAICFKKAVRKYITEDLGMSITPPIFGDKYPEKNPEVITPRVWVHFIDGLEEIYQALEEHGDAVFADTPIRLRLRSRKDIYHNTPLPEGVEANILGCTVVIVW